MKTDTTKKGHEARAYRRLLQTELQSFPADMANRLTTAFQSLSLCKPHDEGETSPYWIAAKELHASAEAFPPVIAFYIKLLQELPGHSPKTSQVCKGVIWTLGLLRGDLGDLITPAIEVLAAHLKAVFTEATESLRRLSWTNPQSVQDALYRRLCEFPLIWDQAACLLGEMLPGQVNVTGQWLESDAPGVYAAAIAYLAMVNRSNEGVASIIKSAMVDPDYLIRCAAVQGAFHLPIRADVRDLLLRALHDPVYSVRLAWAESIRGNAIWCRAMLPELSTVLREHYCTTLRSSIATGLWLLGKDAIPAIPALMVAAKDHDRSVRAAAKMALDRIVECSEN